MAAVPSISDALRTYGIVDDEGYLVPPEHPNVNRLTLQMSGLMEMQQDGLKLTPQDKLRLKTMQMVFDYYNEALEDLEEEGYVDGDGFVVDDFSEEPGSDSYEEEEASFTDSDEDDQESD
jgi:hypothetical protein